MIRTVRPERRVVLAGASPIRVSAGAPGSGLQPRGLPLAQLCFALPVRRGAAGIADGFSGAGAIHVGRGETRIVFDGRVVVGQGHTIVLAAEMDATAPVQRKRQAGLQFQGPLEIDQCVRVPVQTNQTDASCSIGGGHIRGETNGLRIILDGYLIVLQVLVGHSQAVVGRAVIGTERDGSRKGLNGAGIVLALHLLVAALNGRLKRRWIRAGLRQRRGGVAARLPPLVREARQASEPRVGASPSPGLKRPWSDWHRGAGALAGQPLPSLVRVARQASELPVEASPSAGLKRPWPAWHRQAGALAGQLGVGLLIRQWGPASRLRA